MVILVSFGNQKQLIKLSFAELLCPDHQINSRFDEHLQKKRIKSKQFYWTIKHYIAKLDTYIYTHTQHYDIASNCIVKTLESNDGRRSAFKIDAHTQTKSENENDDDDDVLCVRTKWKKDLIMYSHAVMRSWIVSNSNSIVDSVLYSICRSLSLVQNRAGCCSSFLPEFSILIADCGSCQRRVYVRIEISLDRSKCVRKRRGAECYSTRGCSTFIVINNNEESLPFIHTLFAAFDYISWMNAYRFCARWLFHFFWYRVKAHISIQNNANVIKLSEFNEMTLRTHDKLLDDDLLRKSKQFSIFAVHSVCSVFQALNSNARRLYWKSN